MCADVLIVDDDGLIREVSERVLTRAGFDVAVAATATQALELAADRRFDVAILDYFLGPGDYGCALIAPMRIRHPSMRIAILSGLGVLPELVQHGYAAGANLVASKANVDWVAVARCQRAAPAQPVHPAVDLDALKRQAIHGAYLVHNRNVSSTARALGMRRSNLQRVLRKAPPPQLE